MKIKSKIALLVTIILCTAAGFYFYHKWTTATVWGIFFVVAFIAVPFWIVLTLKLWTRCPRCRRFNAIMTIAAELHKKGTDPHRPPEPAAHCNDEKEESSLDLSLDLYDIFCRYRCKFCNFEWEEKPPPSWRYKGPSPPHMNGG